MVLNLKLQSTPFFKIADGNITEGGSLTGCYTALTDTVHTYRQPWGDYSMYEVFCNDTAESFFVLTGDVKGCIVSTENPIDDFCAKEDLITKLEGIPNVNCIVNKKPMLVREVLSTLNALNYATSKFRVTLHNSVIRINFWLA